ncbi:peptidoglycan DD-metalloendopeptidase family protein [Marinihelvus fidelis]|uniref:Peptidoglycan DD-metalloendopeptidase family protein n=1 Tax=Marinihelvus fidelis TaxID=2613842 RepID=A0A5N0T5S2_9GAMM|nr:M23 family metallopeptidase [Marinihelvus fidelis]KAA9129804.1 peptidoglycan DD-metalloendopeptidase family protein [Marinihelvus fidelis]
MLFIILIEVLVPTVLLGALALSRAPGFWTYLLGVVCYGLALLFMWLVLPWHLTSIYLRMLLPFAFAMAALSGWARIGSHPSGPPPRAQALIGGLFLVALIGAFGFADWKALSGYRSPQPPVRLAMPLRDGLYIVGHGGASRLVNAHYRIRPQDFAVDLMSMNPWGGRRNSWSGTAGPEAYDIFNHRVYAPCDGEVRAAVDGHPDLFPGQTDRHNLAGNHLVLGCEDYKVLLAHLKNGSLLVAAGDIVSVGDELARVGNSGNTSEPHLHIHVARGGQPDSGLDGIGVPFLLDSTFAVRGDVIKPSFGAFARD